MRHHWPGRRGSVRENGYHRTNINSRLRGDDRTDINSHRAAGFQFGPEGISPGMGAVFAVALGESNGTGSSMPPARAPTATGAGGGVGASGGGSFCARIIRGAAQMAAMPMSAAAAPINPILVLERPGDRFRFVLSIISILCCSSLLLADAPGASKGRDLCARPAKFASSSA